MCNGKTDTISYRRLLSEIGSSEKKNELENSFYYTIPILIAFYRNNKSKFDMGRTATLKFNLNKTKKKPIRKCTP